MYYQYMDVLRILAIIGVISMHSSGLTLVESSPDSHQWWIASTYHCLGTWGVPVFVMISGALLLNKDYDSILKFYYKRFIKIVIPAVVWIIIYHFYQLFVQQQSFELITLLKAIFNLYQKGGLSEYFWFIPMIVGLYLAAPYIRIFTKNASTQTIFLSLILWLGFSIILPFLYYFKNIEIGIDKTVFTSWPGYFVLGYFLHSHVKTKRLFCFVIFFSFAFIATIFPAYHFALHHNINLSQPYNPFYGYLTPNVFVMATSIFMFVRNIFLRFQFANMHLIKKISASVFGIFLIHVLFLNPMIYVWNRSFNPVLIIGPFWGIFFLILASFFLSFISVSFIKMIPGLKKIVP